ncbi:MAG: diversity-generating retroelement protein Avd [Nitrospira sp.]|nr:diversity-generating retroelement protein Avd [Nitrospira sp.]MDH4305676.1 diversity-generating retroelement protein Avd [Nitrospira sp.]MDH5195470.1 diversity-generating retroelement protein Avd [Nitrospira sp.]
MPATVPQAVQSCHDLLLWIIPQLDKFPRSRRFTLGESIESGGLEVLELLVEAAYTRNKDASLRRANLKLEVVRHLWRVAHELKVMATRQYEHGARLTDDVGRQIGGWLRSQPTSEPQP